MIQTFAAANADANLALIGILGTVVVSLFAILNYLLKRSDKTLQANTTILAKLDNTISSQDTRDKEFHREVMRHFKAIGDTVNIIDSKADRNLNAINAKTMNVDTMHVKTENVETQNNA